MSTPNAFEVGTVSSGTLREQDLAPSFLSELELHNPAKAEELRWAYPDALDALDADEWVEEVQWLMEDLFDALDACAPEGFYFGAHVGDGADFGFWQNEEGL